jgi:hypothetical protein
MFFRWRHRLNGAALGAVFLFKGYCGPAERSNHPRRVRNGEDVLTAGAFDPIGGVLVAETAAELAAAG